MVLQEFKGCGHNTHLILALVWSKRLSCTKHQLQFSPSTLECTELKPESAGPAEKLYSAN